MTTERTKRDRYTPKKYAAFHMGKVRDFLTPPGRRTNSNRYDDSNPNLSINQDGGDGEKIRILEEKVSSRDEEIIKLKKEIESLKKGCMNCIINAGSGAAAEVAAEEEKEEEEVSVSNREPVDSNTEETNSDAKIKTLEEKVNNLEGIMNEGFNKLTAMIGNIQGNTNNTNVNDRSREQQQQGQQQQGQQQQQQQHQTVNRIQSEGRNQFQPQGNDSSAHLNQLRQERKNNIILFKLPEMRGSASEQWTADLYMTECVLKEMDPDYLENRIENVVRLGRDNSGNNMRPLKVSFRTNIDRETAVRNAYKLRNSEEFSNIGVSRDYIMQDRIEARENYIRNKQQNRSSPPNARTPEPLETEPISTADNGNDQERPQRSGGDMGS